MPDTFIVLDFTFADTNQYANYDRRAVICHRPYLDNLQYISWLDGGYNQETNTIADAIDNVCKQLKEFRQEYDLSYPEVAINQYDQSQYDQLAQLAIEPPEPLDSANGYDPDDF